MNELEVIAHFAHNSDIIYTARGKNFELLACALHPNYYYYYYYSRIYIAIFHKMVKALTLDRDKLA